jgi:hypothetical protein
MISITDAMSDPQLFGPWFSAPSWATWRACLKAAYCEPMTPEDLTLFHAVAGGRALPTQRVKELWAICGRRAGKDSLAALIAAYTGALLDFRDRLRPGERASIACLGVDRTQSRIVHRYIRAFFDQIPLLRPLVAADNDEVLELNNGNEIIISTNSFRAIRGKTYAIATLDEICFWRDENSASPDKEVVEAILPGMATLDDTALLIGISTPFMRAGLAYEKFDRHFGHDDPDVLIVHGPSTAFNPTLPPQVISRALARDPERAKAEWLAEWRDLESAFLPREVIQAAIDTGVAARLPLQDPEYVGFVDAAGGAGQDAFTAAVAHDEGGLAVLDALYEKTPPFSPQQTVAEISGLFAEYRVSTIEGDRFAGAWPAEAFAGHNITYTPAERTRSEIYQETIPLFTSGWVRLLDHKKLADQFAGLRRRVQPGGREQIDHGPNAHDDLCNAAAGALVRAQVGDQQWREIVRSLLPPGMAA